MMEPTRGCAVIGCLLYHNIMLGHSRSINHAWHPLLGFETDSLPLYKHI